jgi:plastocyanin
MNDRRTLVKIALAAAVAVIALALALAGCGYGASTPPTTLPPTTTTPSGTGTQTQSVTVDLTAKNLSFDKSTITVPAGAKVSLVFDNQDAGVPHNFDLYTDSSARTSLFASDRVTGPKQVTFTFTAPATPGDYYFQCDVHPGQMHGTFVVQ